MIFTAQLADKTFIMIIILSMEYPKLQIFLGSSLALIIMHSLAAFAGAIVPMILQSIYIHIGIIVVFAVFGLYMIYKGCRKKNKSYEDRFRKANNELEEMGTIEKKQQLSVPPQYQYLTPEKKKKTIKQGEEFMEDNYNTTLTKASPLQNDALDMKEPLLPLNQEKEQQNAKAKQPKYKVCNKFRESAFMMSPFMKMFLLGLCTEMGDRSQVTAVALGVANQIWGVVIGGSIGHVLCSLVGVLLGSWLAKKVSPSKLIILGGIICELFALHMLIFG